jgi:hypothetical protein
MDNEEHEIFRRIEQCRKAFAELRKERGDLSPEDIKQEKDQIAALPAAAPVIPVAESRAAETPPQGDSTDKEEAQKEGPPATTNLDSTKAEAKIKPSITWSRSMIIPISDASSRLQRKFVENQALLY